MHLTTFHSVFHFIAYHLAFWQWRACQNKFSSIWQQREKKTTNWTAERRRKTESANDVKISKSFFIFKTLKWNSICNKNNILNENGRWKDNDGCWSYSGRCRWCICILGSYRWSWIEHKKKVQSIFIITWNKNNCLQEVHACDRDEDKSLVCTILDVRVFWIHYCRHWLPVHSLLLGYNCTADQTKRVSSDHFWAHSKVRVFFNEIICVCVWNQFILSLTVINGTHPSLRADPCSPGAVLRALHSLGWVIPPDEHDAHELLHVMLSSLEEEAIRPKKVSWYRHILCIFA